MSWRARLHRALVRDAYATLAALARIGLALADDHAQHAADVADAARVAFRRALGLDYSPSRDLAETMARANEGFRDGFEAVARDVERRRGARAVLTWLIRRSRRAP
jgi:hypothetical protein